MVSNSRRTPWATPAASFISRAASSKNRLLVCVIGVSGPIGAIARHQQWQSPPAIARARSRLVKLIHVPAELDFAVLLAASPLKTAKALAIPYASPLLAISRLRSGAGLDRAVPDPLVCAGLYRRHPARLALCAGADPQRAPVGRPGAADTR